MRFRLAAGERSSVYHPGQFVSASYAARYPDKVRGDEPPEIDYIEPPDFPIDYDWEITAYYDET